MANKMKYAFVVNRNAGKGSAVKKWTALEARVAELFEDYSVVYDLAPIATDADVVVAVGGDGTVHYVVNHLMRDNRHAALGILPLGSGCDFARNFETDDALAVLARGETKAIDVGEIESAGNKMWFANVADAGMGAEVTRQMASHSRNYLFSTLKALVGYKNVDVRLSADGEEVYVGPLKCLVMANGKYFGDGMGIAPDAVLDDGLLQYVIIGDISRLMAAIKLQQTYKCTRIKHRHVYYGSARELCLEVSSALAFEADGELMAKMPAGESVYIRAIHHALNLVAEK
ncbi:MAG: YegS/Rv2252/BmrU family lipid kinase [Planctomycetota bacterium]|nr:YegS/Rv2252/BmrU family lipid kinase [Planctomycetota bacterium]